MKLKRELKKLGIGLLMVCSLVLIAGCSSSSKEQESKDTKIVQTDKGEVEIPANPTRIVSDYYLGEFLAVDTKPIIASPYALENPFLADYIEGIEPLNITSAETSLEMIAQAEPDLIVTITEADYDKYSKIAPTVYIEDGKRSDEELFEYIASLVNKEEEAKQYMDDFYAKANEMKPAVQDVVKDQTVSIVEVWPQQIYSMGSHFARGGTILYDLWDLKAPEVVQKEMVDGDEAYKVISLEALPEYTGDYILYGVLSDTEPDFVEDSAIWNNLPAVKDGQVMPYQQVAFMHRDPISLNGQMDELYAFFTKNGE
ncbi:hypothetical protein C815_01808 [Firmicutes bacterium M10-2]|nr:hypothetical protein C815_01808 [Firmicutes bacterium M10-2]